MTGASPYQKVKLVSGPLCKLIGLKGPASCQLLCTVYIDTRAHAPCSRGVGNPKIKLPHLDRFSINKRLVLNS